jgi:hypothetical protein
MCMCVCALAPFAFSQFEYTTEHMSSSLFVRCKSRQGKALMPGQPRAGATHAMSRSHMWFVTPSRPLGNDDDVISVVTSASRVCHDPPRTVPARSSHRLAFWKLDSHDAHQLTPSVSPSKICRLSPRLLLYLQLEPQLLLLLLLQIQGSARISMRGTLPRRAIRRPRIVSGGQRDGGSRGR